MSGLEVLSVVANVLSVIDIGFKVATICKDIYDGNPTKEDVLEECATSMSTATADLLKYNSQVQSQGSVGKDLADMAKKCDVVARDLASEVQSIMRSRSKRNVISAI